MNKKTTKTTTKTDTTQQEPVAKISKTAFHLRMSLLAVVLCAALFGGLFWFYRDHALPNVSVGNISVGQHSRAEVEQLIKKQQELLQVTFFNNQEHVTVPAKDLGVTINVTATANQVMETRQLMLWQTEKIPLVLQTDPGVLRHYIQTHYPSIYVDATDAQLIYNANTKQFDIKPGTPGKGFDVAWFEAQLPDLASNPRTLALKVETAPIEPIITEKSLQKTQAIVNKQLTLPITFLAQDKIVYTASSDDIASLVQFIPDAIKGTVRIDYDKAKVAQFLSQKVAPAIARPAIDKKVIVDKQTGSQFVITAGQDGQQIREIEAASSDVIEALTHSKPLAKTLTMEQAPFKTIMLEGGDHWLEVDLSEQRLIMYSSQTPVRSFLISSGKARTPTPTGTFYVYLKRTSQTMTGTFAGDHFYLPNVKWVNYINGDVAIHGTYWHNNFGTPMSHGCINMTESAAKIVYDFAPVGTRVVVHH